MKPTERDGRGLSFSFSLTLLATGRPKPCTLRTKPATPERSPEAWIAANRSAYTRMIGMETEIRRAESFDLTTLSVALRQLRNLTVNAAR